MEKQTNVCTGGGSSRKPNIIKKSTWIFLIEILLMIMLCIMHSIGAGHYADYYPINGTFQNYNPVRRLLSGQVPYRDFQDYLGLGHLYMGSLFTVIFGGTYKDSLVAFSFLTFGGLAILTNVLGLAVFRRKEIAAALTNIVLAMLMIQPLFFTNAVVGTSEILGALNYALGTGNSARFVRGMILPLVILILWLAYGLYEGICKKNDWARRHKMIITYGGIGLLAGFSFTWSNDYGISCWVCLVIMTFWLAISRTRKLLPSLAYTGIELLTSFVGIVLTILVFTRGHLIEWIGATFGTGGYQSWYYNSSKSYYLYDVDFSYIMLIQAGIAIAYLIKVFADKGKIESVRRYGIPGFINMVCFCAVNEYKMLSGGGSREVALATLFITIVFEICKFVSHKEKRRKEAIVIIVASCIISSALIVSVAKDELIFKYMTNKDGVYLEALGGNLTYLGNDLIETNDFLDGEEFFATYASAQEVVSNTFQPSGTDYIIHVLGDKQREDYLESFKSEEFRYAATIKETFTDWEYWVQRANWFFYRNLYSEWHPVFANTYEVYWEKSENGNSIIQNDITLSVDEISETSKKIVVQTNSSVNGIADVYIDYAVNKKSNRSAFLVFQESLFVENSGTVYAGQGSYYESNYLRPESKEYIPIPIINGYGEVTLSSGPERSTYLQLNDVSCERIFTCSSDYMEIEDVIEENSTGQITIFNIAKNRNSIASAKSLMIQGKEYLISEVTSDDNYIYIFVDSAVDYNREEGNYLQVLERVQQ